jgi:RNA polymerase sigma-70 factor (ECF subfamily)
MVEYNADIEKRLVMKAKEGDLQAFNQLYDAQFRAVYSRVRYKVPETDIEDVTQEIFISMVKGLKRFKGQSSLKTWLRTITNRKIADYYRKKKDREISQGNEQVMDYLDGQNDDTRFRKKHDNAILLKRSLKNLPDHYQEVILLRFVDEYKFQEIAEIIGKSLEATKSQYRRAIAALRDEVNQNHGIQ